ncbi:DUF4352 domain-containing protein [Nocardiopsis protaetiae]|uniref:DUF4352 domain-containing protein n=1 Tax=Nocardiopsis protaetiae TaxID=3382270 RepID=UPI00387B566D
MQPPHHPPPPYGHGPHPGYPGRPGHPPAPPAGRKKSSPWPWIGAGCAGLAVLVIIALVAVVFFVSSNDDRGGTFAVGERFEVKNVQYTVTSVQTDKGSIANASGHHKPQHAYTVITVTVENTGFRPAVWVSNDIGLYSGGIRYASNSQVAESIQLGSTRQTLDPGDRVSVTVVFDVPDSSQSTHLILSPEGSARLAVTIDL